MSTWSTSRLLLVAPALAALSFQVGAQERDRSQIPDQHKWNLADVYPSDDAWRAAKAKVAADLPRLKQFQGKLQRVGRRPGRRARHAVCARQGAVAASTSTPACWPTRTRATRRTKACGRRWCSWPRRSAPRPRSSSRRSCGLPTGTVARFLAAEPRLKPYRFYLEDIARRAPHTLTPSEEKILADAAPLAGSPSSIYNILTNADFPYPTVTLSDGREVKVNQADFSAYRASANRAGPRRRPCRRSSAPSAASAARSARR